MSRAGIEETTSTRDDAAAGELRAAYEAFIAENPGTHRRDAARALGVSEAVLIASTIDDVVRLDDTRWADLVAALPRLGHVKTMTRNEEFVIEETGVYDNIEFFGQVGQGVAPGFDLRIFLARWGAAFAVTEETRRGTRRSIQIFDGAGSSVHKCFVESDEGIAPFEAIVEEFRAEEQPGALEFEPFPKSTYRPVEEIDQEAFRKEWDEMRDTHDFFGLLGRHRVRRTDGLRIAGESRAQRLEDNVFEDFLNQAAEKEIPLMFFVGNPGMIQIYSGPINRVVRARGWLNILDPGFNLHARDQDIAEAWVVRKPVPEGYVTSLELYNAAGEDVAIIFSVRDDGVEESAEWRELVAGLPRKEAT